MTKTHKRILVIGTIVVLFLPLAGWYLSTVNIPVLQPKGEIAQKQYDLIILTLLLSLIVVIPVFIMLFSFAWRYREDNKKARYSPEFDHSRILETIWWLIPTALIVTLGVIIWRSSYELDPYKPLASTQQPIHIQVVALDWKWLFIYPDQGVASVGQFEVPTNVPVQFDITADAPMNSFWLPQLGGQIYAMPGMSTRLNLVANKPGLYRGSSANISGRGFADMTFTARATTTADYQSWVRKLQQSPRQLDVAAYERLSQPSILPTARYSHPTTDLYDMIVMQYMLPNHQMVAAQHQTKTDRVVESE